MGKASREKGKKGQREFKALLEERNWTFMESRAGADEEDILAIRPQDGQVFAVEVKNCLNIEQAKFLKQAKEQAAKRGKKVRWLLACAIHGFGDTFLVVTSSCCEIWRKGR